MASIRKRGDSFTITVYVGCEKNGKQIRKNTTFHPPKGVSNSKAEKLANAYAIKWENEIRGYTNLDENRTVEELVDWYYSTVAYNVLKPNTYKTEHADIENHVLPVIGKEKLKNVTPAMLDSLINNMRNNNVKEKTLVLSNVDSLKRCGAYKLHREYPDISIPAYYRLINGKTCKRETALQFATALGKPVDELFVVKESGGLRGTSIRKIMGTLSAVFSAAEKKEIIRRNPCRMVTKPKNDAKKTEFLNEEQSRLLLQLIHEKGDLQFELLINLLISTGLRIGEALSLHWDDVDFEKNTVFVRTTLVRIGKEWVRQKPKTEKSERRVAIPKEVNELLTLHKKTQLDKFARFLCEKDIPVFSTSNGNYLWTTGLNSILKRYIKGSGLPEIHFHTLRHTHASLLINNGIPVKTISERLGHSNTKMTLEVYSHMFENADIAAKETVSMLLYSKDKI